MYTEVLAYNVERGKEGGGERGDREGGKEGNEGESE